MGFQLDPGTIKWQKTTVRPISSRFSTASPPRKALEEQSDWEIPKRHLHIATDICAAPV